MTGTNDDELNNRVSSAARLLGLIFDESAKWQREMFNFIIWGSDDNDSPKRYIFHSVFPFFRLYEKTIRAK